MHFLNIRLRNLQLEEWGNDVTVVSCDMRKWQAPEKVEYYSVCSHEPRHPEILCTCVQYVAACLH